MTWRLIIIFISDLGKQKAHGRSVPINLRLYKYYLFSLFPLHLISASVYIMAINNLWFPPALGVIKINVHGVVDENMHTNGNFNSKGW